MVFYIIGRDQDDVWVFVAQLIEHCSANEEGMGSNPVEVPNFFFGLICNCSKCNYHCDDHIFIEIKVVLLLVLKGAGLCL